LLHPEVGAADRCRPGTAFKHANMKKYRKRCQWALIPRYTSHIASNAAICWMLFGLRCCSWRPY
jgi:hypothetical protein